MVGKILRMTVGGVKFTARRGIPDTDDMNNPHLVTCFSCRQRFSKRAPQADCIQYGFEWDTHITIFKCRCGAMFFHEYKIWHIQGECEL